MHDGWSPYWRYPVTHALCGAHLLRELEAITDEPGQGWAAGMAELLADAKTQADRAPDPRGRWAGQACLGPPRQGRAGRLYDALRRFPPVIGRADLADAPVLDPQTLPRRSAVTTAGRRPAQNGRGERTTRTPDGRALNSYGES